MDGVYYQHSGKYSGGGLLVGSVLALVVGCVTAWLYSYLILYIPIAGYISFLFSAAFGAVLGYGGARLLKQRLVRNTGAALAAIFVVTSIAFYFSWAVWVNAFLRRNEVDSSLALTLLPNLLWSIIGEINAQGAWTIRSWTPTGWALWGIWGLEAAIIYGVALVVANGEMNDQPFCENCQVWCKETEAVVNVAAAPDLEELKRRMETRDIKYLEQLGPMGDGAMAWEQVDLHTCPKCNSTNTLKVQHVTVKMEKNEVKQETANAVNKIVLTAMDADSVRRLPDKFKSAQTAAAAGATAGS